jgi:hypothetical protein
LKFLALFSIASQLGDFFARNTFKRKTTEPFVALEIVVESFDGGERFKIASARAAV